MLMKYLTLAMALAASTAGPLRADDVALLLGTERYEALGRTVLATDMLGADGALEQLGFKVIALRNGRADTTAAALADFLALVPDADRLLVVLSGRFATDGGQSWFLTAEADAPNAFSVAMSGISLESLLRVLATAPGQAVLVLGAEANDTDDLGPLLRAGIGPLTIPQGVTVLRGEPRDVGVFVRTRMVQPAADLIASITQTRQISAEGYVPRSLVFMPAQRDVAIDTTDVPPVSDTASENALWDGARALDTVDAYRNYLRRYPAGRHAGQAEALIAEIISEPNRAARLAEDALSLSRDQRREVQRSLSLLGYNTRGIDGIFGPGSRGAVTNWQQQNGYSQTSYLTAEQISRLGAQASRRAAELEAEAERKRLEEARLDRTYWDETGAKGDEPGYRAYLGRYPDGIFAEVAADRLALIEEDKRRAAEAEDRAAWDTARVADTLLGYQDYLRSYPSGVFKAEADARIAALTQANAESSAIALAADQEQQLGLTPFTARVVETRLEQLGFNPGEIDGTFDDATRRALRRYQRSRDIPVTGYVNEATLVRLLADRFIVNGR
jgi:peptidoglycan hydrolase-like protein with peptidoglycan-binding domain